MVDWFDRHPVQTWGLAWALTGVGLMIADVWSEPRQGPLWVGIAVGIVAWGFAGGVTFRTGRMPVRVLIWASAYGLAFWLGANWGAWFEHNQVGSVSGAGFVGTLLGWAAGAASGALATALAFSRRKVVRALTFGAAWGSSFLVGAYLGLVAAIILSQLSESVLQFLGSEHVARMIGWGVGAALGGILASAMGFAAWRRLFRPATHAAALTASRSFSAAPSGGQRS